MKTTLIRSGILFCFAIFTASCGPNQRILESANQNQATEDPVASSSTNPPSVPSFEQDLDAMRTADFKFIVVFRRKDGKAFDAADKALLSQTAPQANRRGLSDEGKAVLIGSNFPFAAGEFDRLKEKFAMENYSKPDSGNMFTADENKQGVTVNNGRR